MNDMTIVYYTANHIPEKFFNTTMKYLKLAIGDKPVISVSHKPMNFGKNICVGKLKRNARNIYKQLLIGAREAKTKYIATAEDDVLYSASHYNLRPKDNHFLFNMNKWSLFTWNNPPLYSWRNRISMAQCIVERNLLIEALEERFEKHPDENNYPDYWWGEPTKYDDKLKVTKRNRQRVYSKVPTIIITHENSLGFEFNGTRKRVGFLRAYDIPKWGKAKDIIELLKEE